MSKIIEEKKIRKDPVLGKNLRKLRKDHDYTQEEIVARLQLQGSELKRGSYAQIEAGLLSISPSDLVLLKLIYDVPFEVFFDGINGFSVS